MVRTDTRGISNITLTDGCCSRADPVVDCARIPTSLNPAVIIRLRYLEISESVFRHGQGSLLPTIHSSPASPARASTVA